MCRHYFEKTVEAQNTPFGPELVFRCFYRDYGTGELRGHHLTGDKLLPDQCIQPLCIAVHSAKVRRLETDVRRTDSLMGLLSTLLAAIATGFLWQVPITIGFKDKVTTIRYSLRTEVGRVGSHVGDEAAFIKLLRHGHCLLHTETEPRAGCLLQCGRNEGSTWPGLCRLVFPRNDFVIGVLQCLDCCLGLLSRLRFEIAVAVFLDIKARNIVTAGS